MSMLDLSTIEGATRWLRENYPAIAGGLLPDDAPNVLKQLSVSTYEAFVNKARGSRFKIEAGLESFAQMSYDFLRLQARFLRTGRYETISASSLLNALYLDAKRMEGYYLDGLVLTYTFWPNHVKLIKYFRDKFISRLEAEPRLVEIGVGHGLMGLMALTALPGCHYTGLDISPSSLNYARKLWETNNADYSDTVLKVADAVDWVPPEGTDGGWECALCCEVLEHVERPEAVLEALRRALKPGGKAFVTTVANIAAEDHIYLFKDAASIRNLCETQGLSVDDECVLPLKGFEDKIPQPLNYAAILVKP